MNFNQLINQFNNGINWNACFYIVYKCTSTFVTFLLYKYLTPHDFALWAIINSTIYIVLLWSDLGLRKSIPRYSPIFAKDNQANKRFIKYIVYFYISVLCLLGALFVLGTQNAAHIYSTSKVTSYLLFCAPAIFIFEGINSLFKLLFHAYFYIKQYNLLATNFLIINMILDIIVIYTTRTSSVMLKYIFINKMIVGGALAITSLYLFCCKKTHNNQKNITPTIHFNKTMQAFTKHSGMMWINTCIKSLSERNSLIPIIALFGGAQSASLFKIANDGALLFQRIVLKSIGTTDTSLLAHIETSNEGGKLLQVAFTKLTQKMAALCLPLLGISLYIGISSLYSQETNEVFQIFIMLTICYLVETLLLPYERILEVKHNHKLLLIAYAPYVIFLMSIIFYISKTWIGLLPFLSLVYCVRLVSVFIMVLFAQRKYHVQYPTNYALNLLGLISTTSIGLYIVSNIINVNPYISFVSLFSRLKNF